MNRACHVIAEVVWSTTPPRHLPSMQCWHDLVLYEQSLSCYSRGGVIYNSTTSSALHAMLTWFGPVWTELVMLWQRWCDLQLHHVICPPCNVDMIWTCVNRACHVIAEVVWSTTPPRHLPSMQCWHDLVLYEQSLSCYGRGGVIYMYNSTTPSALHAMLTWFGLCMNKSLSCYTRGGVIYNSTTPSALHAMLTWFGPCMNRACHVMAEVVCRSTTSSALHAMLTWFGPVWTELIMLWQRWCDLHVQLHHVICPPCNVDMIWSSMNRACHVMAEMVW